MAKKTQLLGDMDDYGGLDMFGLDEFGQPGGMNPAWGAALGSVLGAGTAIAVRKMAAPSATAAGSPQALKFSELIGAGVSAVAGGVMIAFGRTRGMGWATLAAGTLGGLVRQAEHSLLETAPKTGTQAGYGEVVIDQIPRLHMNGLHGNMGIVTTEQVPTLQGFDGNPRMPSLVGPPSFAGLDSDLATNPGASQVRLLGGPPLSGLGSHYGATLFSH